MREQQDETVMINWSKKPPQGTSLYSKAWHLSWTRASSVVQSLSHEESRFFMRETLREYGLEWLVARVEMTAIPQIHAHHFLKQTCTETIVVLTVWQVFALPVDSRSSYSACSPDSCQGDDGSIHSLRSTTCIGQRSQAVYHTIFECLARTIVYEHSLAKNHFE